MTNARLTKHILKCFCRFSEHQKAKGFLPNYIPKFFFEKKYLPTLEENSRKILNMLFLNLQTNSAKHQVNEKIEDTKYLINEEKETDSNEVDKIFFDENLFENNKNNKYSYENQPVGSNLNREKTIGLDNNSSIKCINNNTNKKITQDIETEIFQNFENILKKKKMLNSLNKSNNNTDKKESSYKNNLEKNNNNNINNNNYNNSSNSKFFKPANNKTIYKNLFGPNQPGDINNIFGNNNSDNYNNNLKNINNNFYTSTIINANSEKTRKSSTSTITSSSIDNPIITNTRNCSSPKSSKNSNTNLGFSNFSMLNQYQNPNHPNAVSNNNSNLNSNLPFYLYTDNEKNLKTISCVNQEYFNSENNFYPGKQQMKGSYIQSQSQDFLEYGTQERINQNESMNFYSNENFQFDENNNYNNNNNLNLNRGFESQNFNNKQPLINVHNKNNNLYSKSFSNRNIYSESNVSYNNNQMMQQPNNLNYASDENLYYYSNINNSFSKSPPHNFLCYNDNNINVNKKDYDENFDRNNHKQQYCTRSLQNSISENHKITKDVYDHNNNNLKNIYEANRDQKILSRINNREYNLNSRNAKKNAENIPFNENNDFENIMIPNNNLYNFANWPLTVVSNQSNFNDDYNENFYMYNNKELQGEGYEMNFYENNSNIHSNINFPHNNFHNNNNFNQTKNVNNLQDFNMQNINNNLDQSFNQPNFNEYVTGNNIVNFNNIFVNTNSNDCNKNSFRNNNKNIISNKNEKIIVAKKEKNSQLLNKNFINSQIENNFDFDSVYYLGDGYNVNNKKLVDNLDVNNSRSKKSFNYTKNTNYKM